MKLPQLKTLRRRAALSQVELAQKASVSVATIQRSKAGHSGRYGNIRKLAEALGVQPADIIGSPPEDTNAEARPRADADAQRGTASEVEGYT